MSSQDRAITGKQAHILNGLNDGPLTIRELMQTITGSHTKDQVQSSLRRMENREFVRRLDRVTSHIFRMSAYKWELTAHGRKMLDKYWESAGVV